MDPNSNRSTVLPFWLHSPSAQRQTQVSSTGIDHIAQPAPGEAIKVSRQSLPLLGLLLSTPISRSSLIDTQLVDRRHPSFMFGSDLTSQLRDPSILRTQPRLHLLTHYRLHTRARLTQNVRRPIPANVGRGNRQRYEPSVCTVNWPGPSRDLVVAPHHFGNRVTMPVGCANHDNDFRLSSPGGSDADPLGTPSTKE
jgi:hypothetical protein